MHDMQVPRTEPTREERERRVDMGRDSERKEKECQYFGEYVAGLERKRKFKVKERDGDENRRGHEYAQELDVDGATAPTDQDVAPRDEDGCSPVQPRTNLATQTNVTFENAAYVRDIVDPNFGTRPSSASPF